MEPIFPVVVSAKAQSILMSEVRPWDEIVLPAKIFKVHSVSFDTDSRWGALVKLTGWSMTANVGEWISDEVVMLPSVKVLMVDRPGSSGGV